MEKKRFEVVIYNGHLDDLAVRKGFQAVLWDHVTKTARLTTEGHVDYLTAAAALLELFFLTSVLLKNRLLGRNNGIR